MSSTQVECVSTLLSNITESSLASSLDSFEQFANLGQVQFHTLAQPTSTAKFALPKFWKVSVFPEARENDRSMQVGRIGYLPNDFDCPESSGVSGPDSFGLATIQMPDCDSTADFAEDILGMELLAVMVLAPGTTENTELYFYGFSRPSESLDSYSVLELGQTQPETVIDLTDTGPAVLAQVQLTYADLAFFADRLCNADLEIRPIESRDEPVSHYSVNARSGASEPGNLGVFSTPLGG